MTLNQEQIGQAGEAMNDAMYNNVISRDLRNRTVENIYGGKYAVGDVELIACARKVRQDSKTNAAYLGALDAYIAILTGTQAAQPTTPPAVPISQPPVATPPTGTGVSGLPTIPPLAVTDIQKLSEALWKGIGITAMTQEMAARIEAAVTSGEYIYGDYPLIGAVKEVLFIQNEDGSRFLNAIDLDVVNRFRAIIDQRIPDGPDKDKPLPLTDPRFQFVKGLAGSTSAPTPVPSGPISGEVVAQVMAVLAAAGLRISNGCLLLRVASGFTVQLGLSENDSGLRVMYNTDFNFGTGWVDPVSGKRTAHVNPKLPRVAIDVERDAVVSMNFAPALLDGNGGRIPQPAPDAPKGKDILFRPGGLLGGGAPFIGCGKPGVALDLGVVPAGGSPNSPAPQLRIKASGVYVVENSAERRL